MKNFIICFLALTITSTAFAQRTSTKKATPVAVQVEDDEFPALKLTDEQRSLIKEIDAEISERMNGSERTPAMQTKMEEKMSAYRLEKIRAILTPEQQVIFDEGDKAKTTRSTTPGNIKISELNVDEISKMIELKEDQVNEIRTIFAEMDQHAKEHGNNEAEVQNIKAKKVDALRGILNEEQFLRLNEMMK